MPIRIGIVGYGNLGRGVELAIAEQPDLALAGIYTRRPPETLAPATQAPVRPYEEILAGPNAGSARRRDVLIQCAATHAARPHQNPRLASSTSVRATVNTLARRPHHDHAPGTPNPPRPA